MYLKVKTGFEKDVLFNGPGSPSRMTRISLQDTGTTRYYKGVDVIRQEY